MALNQKRLKAALRNYDIIADQSWEELGSYVAELLKTKTYCVINADWKPGTLEAAQRQARELRKTSSHVQVLPEEITDGLLGREGSHKTLQLGDGVVPKDSMLDRMQVEMFRIADSLKVWFPPAQGPHEGMDPILNISGVPEATPVPLTEKLVKEWRNIYIRQSLLILICLGPRDGILELTPVGDEEENTAEVVAQAGSIIVLKPEWLWHTLRSPSKTMVLSCFWLAASNQYYRINYHYLHMPPTAEVLDEWMFLRLKELKDMEDEEDHGKTWGALDNPDIPRDWQNMMNHLFFKGHMMSVIGIAARVPPSDYTFEEWFRGQTMATDTATVVPMTRWSLYEGMRNRPQDPTGRSGYASFDPAPDSWMDMKVYCKHGCFLDDVTMFDNKFFSIGNAEARTMDPHQRQVMEVAYDTLSNAGFSKKDLLDKNCGVYVGMMQESQWLYVERIRDVGEVDYKAQQATATAASIASNRVSFCLGMKGASMTLDVESASGLCAVYNASGSLEPRGRARPSDAALALSAHLILSRQMWPQYCATKLLSAEGRCFAFSDDADGYILADSVGGLMLKLEHGDADGTHADALPSDSSWSYGSVAGMAMNNNGRSSKLMGASGPAQQEVIYMAVRNASISCLDVDAVEAHATGDKMRDAIEQGSFSKMLRDEFSQDPLILSAGKTLMGHACAAGGTIAFMRALLSIRYGWISPSLHLEIVNPNHVMADICFMGVEMAQYKLESAFVGVGSFGFGGTNVSGLVWGRCWEPSDEEFTLNPEAHSLQVWG